MNRKITYRGQRTDTKEWVYGNLLKLETDYFTDSNDTGFMWYIIPAKTNGSWSKEKLMLKFISPCYEVIPETVGQFIGLWDKNEKKIYEGDITVFDCYSYEEPENTYTGEIIYCNGNECFSLNGYDECGKVECVPLCEIGGSYTTIIEVIGNIYDNKDLLEVEE